ncbi:transglutaminase domain-containing protein [Flavobacterium piscinae]|uniref:Transglutaminase domain-containing protein n=1 Tax=Flavobacterium piscinae TaxID=2506424 RepID=A0A4V1N3M0_9FLAO|nr:transglutaminase-like domain-containing protein [Flavobacterium piscinae]RXR29136.1 transglutaminase domain-containing protein [Flavobacterium piscinae]
MHFKTILFLFLLGNLSVWSQKNIDPTPSDIELAKTIRGKYSKQDVAILESTEIINFGFNKSTSNVTVDLAVNEILMNINHRADIYKYEFYDSSSKIETFLLKYRNEKTASLPIRDEFYKDKDLFYNDARVKHVQIDFPVQGYTYNYAMNKKFEDVKYFTSLHFNDEFPVIDKKIEIIVPDWLEVELKEMNFNGHTIIKSQTKDAKNKSTRYLYHYKDIPAVFNEESSPGRSYLYPHILVLAKSYDYNGKKGTLFNTTADLYRWYKSLVDQMKDDTEQLKSKVNELTAKATSDEEKIKNIYYWVQDNIRYIAFEDGIAGFKPDDSHQVFTKRYGDCKGMANLTKQMLKIAGFDARLTWIGTKHIAYNYSIPSLIVDNHMICTVFQNGKKIYLDGTEKFSSLGNYAERIQNKEVMIENGNEFIIDKIPTSSAESNKETFRAKLVIEKDKLIGTCNRTYSGESRSQFLNIYNSFESDKKAEALQYYLAKSDKNNKVKDIKPSDLKNRDAKLVIDYAFESSNRISEFDNEIYLNFEFMNEYKSFTFKERETDYELDYKTLYDSEIIITLPDGYKVDNLPENLSEKNEDFDIQITFSLKGKDLVYRKVFTFKNAIIRKSQQELWNAAHKKLTELYNSSITLSKS